MSNEINHSTLAMQAAKRMRRVKQKRKNGHVICHHLKKMLDDQQMLPSVRSPVNTLNLARDLAGSIVYGQAVVRRMDAVPAGVLAEKQFSLGLGL